MLIVTYYCFIVQVGVIEAELTKLTAEQLLALKEPLNNMFSKCVLMLGHEHHIRVAHSLQVNNFTLLQCNVFFD